MGYTIAKNISIKKDGRITVTGASSNIYPKTFETFEAFSQIDSAEERLELIFEELLGGMIQFQSSSRSKVHYAFLKSLDYLNEKYQSVASDLWHSRYTEGKYDEDRIEEIRKEIFGVFKESLNQKISMSEKKYAVLLENGYYLHKMNMYSYRYSGNKKFFTINQAMSYARSLGGRVVQ